ncbi:MAG TPA: restriction endonuclease subunit R [Alphaproteobacteria bacterium]|nr:restriction endonuclease subunit R [Alphaproteobacteria bacterium]
MIYKVTEADTRAEYIDQQLKDAGWGVIPDSKILREYTIAPGKIQTGGRRHNRVFADYVLVYKNVKLAVVEAKSIQLEVGEGVAQAKDYATRLNLDITYAANGKEIYQMDLVNAHEELVDRFLSPEELWSKKYQEENLWLDKFREVPFELKADWTLRYYQENAVQNALEAIAKNKDRILLTLATGTGKTAISFQIAWKLFKTKWNLRKDGTRAPRILFLADRNILADQAFNSFSAFPDDALVRIKPDEIKKKGFVPKNGSLFFTIFQTFMSGKDKNGNDAPYFGDYPADYFDFIIIDECHRGGANDESNWRAILDYFSPAVQLGLTATPKREINADTYNYFGEPVYIYSLKEGINDGFLTPFKTHEISTTLDEYYYTNDDRVTEGEIEEGKLYTESDFNKNIEIREREEYRVKKFLDLSKQNEKAIVFCHTEAHAALVRDLINQHSKSKNPHYCVRVTASDNAMGEQYLREFQDNEKTIPTILTTSRKLSTGVDARNIRNIVLMRPVNSMIEFKQIIGRGTRLYEGKEYFTVYDFVEAYKNYLDPEWDGEPIEPVETEPREPRGDIDNSPIDNEPKEPTERKKKIKVKLRDGKSREIQSMMSTSFWSADGTPISAQDFLSKLFGELPKFFKNEEELREIWSNPETRSKLLSSLDKSGYSQDDLNTLKSLIDADNSDLFDVLEYVAFSVKPITRLDRVSKAKDIILNGLNDNEKDFINFVLSKYIDSGETELSQDKLTPLLKLKYNALDDAKKQLGNIPNIKELFLKFQKNLYTYFGDAA